MPLLTLVSQILASMQLHSILLTNTDFLQSVLGPENRTLQVSPKQYQREVKTIQINANFKRSADSLKLLERLGEIEELQGGNVKILFNNRSPEDQKLLQALRASLNSRRWYHKLTPETLKTLALATVLSMATMVYGFASLFGFPAY